MANALRRQQDVLLIPRLWWSALQDSLGPEESGWWYTVSDDIYFQECRTCERRLGKDHQDATRCPKCPEKISKRKNPDSKKTQGKSQIVRSGPVNDRTLRPRLDRNDTEPDSDDANMTEDSEEMQQGYLCTSADPRRIGEGDGDQTLWMTTAQAGFPITRDEEEVTNGKDAQMGRITSRYLHPVISTFITDWASDLTSSGKQPSPLEQLDAIDLENEWSQKYITGIWEASTDPPPSSASWELDPPPLTANHPPRITDSNTRITLREDSLKEPLPKSDNGLGWVQIQQKSLRWEELIQGSPIITHEGLTTLGHPNRGWTITSGLGTP